MSQWRALSLFTVVVTAAVVGLAPGRALGQPGEEPDSFEPQEPRERSRPPRVALSDSAIDLALRHGRSERGKSQALEIRDAGRGLMNALSRMADEPTDGSGFWIEVYTPISWIEQLSSDASKDYRDLSPRDLEPEDLDAVLRITVHPDMPDRVTHKGMRLSASVEHVVIKPKGRKDEPALQPIYTREFDETARGRHGRRATFAGVEAVFDLEDLARVRELARDGEFDVIIIGSGDREKTFSVKKKHFDRLPGLPMY